MFGSMMVEVAIGLTFVYILLAVVVSEVIELISRMRSWRSNTLQDGIRNLLGYSSGQNLAADVLSNPLIRRLSRSGKPSYIPSRNFALSLIEAVPGVQAAVQENLESLKAKVIGMPDGDLKRALLSHLNSATTISEARENIEKWFDDAMERVSGWYTRKARLLGLILALIVTVVINADSLMIANSLTKNDVLRDSIVEASSNPNFTLENLEQGADCAQAPNNINCQIEGLALPIGWSLADSTRGLPDGGQWVGKIIGLLITAVAVSLGAPFWFQFLGRLTALRQGLRQSGAAPQQPSQPRG